MPSRTAKRRENGTGIVRCLMCRCRGRAREIDGNSVGSDLTTRFGPLSLDRQQRTLTRDGREIHVTPKAFDLLLLLVDQAPRIVPKGELHQRLWPATFVSDATLVGLIKELRRALDDRDSAEADHPHRQPSGVRVRAAARAGYGTRPEFVALADWSQHTIPVEPKART